LYTPPADSPYPWGERAKNPRPISKQRDEKDEAETESWNTALLSISIHMMLHNTVQNLSFHKKTGPGLMTLIWAAACRRRSREMFKTHMCALLFPSLAFEIFRWFMPCGKGGKGSWVGRDMSCGEHFWFLLVFSCALTIRVIVKYAWPRGNIQLW
jgi:hypothetical protein